MADEKELLEKVTGEATKAIEKFKDEYKSIAEKAAEGKMSKEDVDKALKELGDKANQFTSEQMTELTKQLDEVKEELKKSALELKSLKENKMTPESKNKLREDLKGWMGSEDFKSWANKNYKGSSPELELKYSLTSGRTGTVLVSSRSAKVSDEFEPRKMHVRDLMSVLPTDMSNHVFDKVTAWTPGCDMVSENGDAPTFDVTTEEQSVSVKRVAGIMDISNNAMRSADYIIRHIESRAPEKLLNVEDFQILFGDGAGNNLSGLYKNATTFDLTGPSFAATAISSVATYDGGDKILVTFAAAHGLTNANKITIANATEATYNSTFTVNVKSEKQIVLDVAYVAEADTSAWTATSKHYLYQSVDGAQEYDVLISTKAFMANSEYSLSAYVLNPAVAAKIEMLKATDEQYVGKIQRINGTLFVAGIPVIEHNSMPAGKFFGGDFAAAAELLQYEGISMRFVEDVDYVKANKQALYITEQLLLPIYNPFMFVKGDFATAKAALETA